MTEKQFFAELRKCRDKFIWDFSGPNRLIRGTDQNSGVCCPVTAVCSALHDNDYSTSDYPEAASWMALDQDVADLIADAADVHDGHKTNRKIRLRILKALGLEDKP